jgi:hypothetical protein
MRVDLPCRRITGPLLLAAWSLVVLAGMVGMVRYQSRPSVGDPAVEHRAPARWPIAVKLHRDPQRPTLIMLLHPHCPCSRASLRELAVLLSRASERPTAYVLLVRPNGAPTDWLNTDLWNDASAIPGVSVVVDPNGGDSRALGATTSGEVAVYDAAGSLRFSGGITDGRGHEGDNTGLDAVLSVLGKQTPRTTSTPVYGCPLLGCERTIDTSVGHGGTSDARR